MTCSRLLCLGLALLAARPAAAAPGKCAPFSLGDCSPDNIIDTVEIPCPDAFYLPQAVEACQQAASKSSHGANFYSYDYGDMLEFGMGTCLIIKTESLQDYVSSCNYVAGPDRGEHHTQEVTDCVPDPIEECDRHFKEDCNYSGATIHESPSVESAAACQVLIESFQFLGAEFFRYDQYPRNYCTLLGKGATGVNCRNVAGPLEPDYLQCHNLWKANNDSRAFF